MNRQPCRHRGPWERKPGGTTSPEIPFTPEEMAILEAVAREKGWVWTFEYLCLCLDQARAIGNLPQNGRTIWPEGFLCGARPKTS
jgi:hypothetical protein